MLTSTLRTSLKVLCGLGLLVGAVSCADMVNNSEANERQGIALYNQGSYAEATGAFRTVIKQDPRDYQARYYLGVCYEKQNQPHLAIQAYRGALDTMAATLRGRDDWAFRVKVMDALAGAVARTENRQVELDSLEQHAKAASTAERRAEDYFLLAKIQGLLGDADSAIQAYNQANLLDPQCFAYRKGAGLYLLSLNQTQAARPHLVRAYALNSKDEEVLAGLHRLGIEPGPSLKDQSELATPAIPKGPIPEVDVTKLWKSNKGGNTAPPTPPTPPEMPANPKD